MLEDDERFKAVEKESDREDLFRSYLVDLQKKVSSLCLCLYMKNEYLLVWPAMLLVYLLLIKV